MSGSSAASRALPRGDAGAAPGQEAAPVAGRRERAGAAAAEPMLLHQAAHDGALSCRLTCAFSSKLLPSMVRIRVFQIKGRHVKYI